ncbi:MAG: PEGA domain-containing protein [Acidobacteriota bacterium]
MFRMFSPVLLLPVCTLAFAQQAQPPASAAAPTSALQSAPQSTTKSSQPPSPNTLLDGTPIKLRLSQTISSADAKVGQEIPFEVMEDVQVDGITVLPKGSTAFGSVTEAEPKRRMGRGGKLNVTISYARLADREKVALRAARDSKGGGHVGAMTGAIVATSIVFFPAAPLFLLMHGKDITIPQGTEITAFVDGDMHLDMASFGAVSSGRPASVAAPTSQEQASLIIESTPPGADIEVDSGFVGNTPSTVTIPPGSHEIVVKKAGFADWSRKLNVTGGTVHLNATLQPAAH